MPNELTNPNNVVTEERLAQFYQQILPYLGGMPDVLANKFNRADLYSTDEKLIGRWIDGKPLYQKTVTIDSLPNATNTEYDVGLTNVSYVNISGYILFPSGNKSNIPYADVNNASSSIEVQGNANDKVAVLVRADRRSCSAVITLQYTKTTDSAVEIGDDTDYSTTEKIVGTWIDGKPIWQKTAYITSGITYSGGMDIGLGSLNIENIVSSSAFCKVGTNGYYPLNFPHPSGGGNMYTYFFSDSSHLLNLRKGGDQAAITAIFLTIQYTKTS